MAFAAMHYANGNISHEKFQLYGLTLAHGGPYVYPDIVFLHCPVPIVKGRIAQRNRPGETAAYSNDYLEMLDETNLFIMLYMWYTNVINVSFLDWKNYQTPDSVISAIEDDRQWQETKGETEKDKMLYRSVRDAIRCNLLTMSYDNMKQLASMLAWSNGNRGVHNRDVCHTESEDSSSGEDFLSFDEILTHLETYAPLTSDIFGI
jgi:hypothetical protein